MYAVRDLIVKFHFGWLTVLIGLVWIYLGVLITRYGKFTPSLRGFGVGKDITDANARLYAIHNIFVGGMTASCGAFGLIGLLQGDLNGVRLIDIATWTMFYAVFAHVGIAVYSVVIRKG